MKQEKRFQTIDGATLMAIISFTNYKRGQSSGCKGAVMRYTMQNKKTLWNGQRLVTGINCQPETVYTDFMMTKRLYRKTDGVMFYHMVQSSPKDETVDPVTAHAAALKLAEYYYYYTKHGAALHALNLDEPYKWHSKSVSYILENEAYLGHTVNLRYTTISFKNKRRVIRPESEQLRFEHTHDALIDETTWNIVQELRAHKRRRTNMDEQDMFSGFVYCMDCGSTMTLSRTRTMSESQYNFTCQNHRKNGKDVCSPHYIREKLLAAVVLDDIRRITHFARQNEVRFAQHIGMKRTSEAQKEINALQKRIDAGARREAELTTLFKRLYEDSALGRIPDKQYSILSNEYLAEQKQIQAELPKLQARRQELKENVANVARFIDMAKKYGQIDELTPEILRTFVRRIEVGERGKRYSRTAPREIKIYYREIGLVDDPPQRMAAEDTSQSREIA